MAKDVVATLLTTANFDHISLGFRLVDGDMLDRNPHSLVWCLRHLLSGIAELLC